MQALVDGARALGWLVYHTYDSRRSAAGFPDLVLVHETKLRLVFIECKRENGRTTRDQDIWLRALEKVAQRFVFQAEHPIDVWIARPSNLDDLISYLKE